MSKFGNYIIIITLFFFSFKTPQDKCYGTFKSRGHYHGWRLKLKPKGTFFFSGHGCTYNYEAKGTWTRNKDTVIIKLNQKSNKRTEDGWKKVNEIKKYFFRNDSLYCIYEQDTGIIISKHFALSRK